VFVRTYFGSDSGSGSGTVFNCGSGAAKAKLRFHNSGENAGHYEAVYFLICFGSF